MPFKKILEELVESIPGANGAILADWEGESVEHYCHFDEFDIKLIGAHKGIILTRLREMHESFQMGDLHDIVITTEEQHLLVGAIGPDYVLVMTAERAAAPTIVLHGLRKGVEILKKEIC